MPIARAASNDVADPAKVRVEAATPWCTAPACLITSDLTVPVKVGLLPLNNQGVAAALPCGKVGMLHMPRNST